MVDQKNITISELDIEHGLCEWREKDSSPRKYHVGCIEEDKVILADFTEISIKEINKLLLDDLCKIAEKTKSENLYAALSTVPSSSISNVVRNMLVYGFEKATKEETAKLTSNPEIIIMKMEVNQEDDFVDLY